MQEIHTGHNVEITPNHDILYRATLETDYTQLLPPIAQMTTGSKIFITVDGDVSHKVLFTTEDGSTIRNGESTYEAKAGDKIMLIAGSQKYSVYDFTHNITNDFQKQIDELTNTVSINTGHILDVNTAIQTIDDELTQTNTNITKIEDDISDNTQLIQDNGITIANQTSRMDGMENQISDLNTGHTGNLNLINQSITNIQNNASAITGNSESISGLQDHVSALLNQGGWVSRRNYNLGFNIPIGTEDYVFLPNTVINEVWIEPDHTTGEFDVVAGREYHVKASWASNTNLATDNNISFEMLDQDQQGVYDIHGTLIRHDRNVIANEDIGLFEINATFVPIKTGKVRLMIHLLHQNDTEIQVSDADNDFLMYEVYGLLKFFQTIFAPIN